MNETNPNMPDELDTKQEEQLDSKKKAKLNVLFRSATLILLVVGMVVYALFIRCQRNQAYNDAVKLFEDKSYKEAAEAFNHLGNYKDSFAYLSKTIRYIKYNDALQLLEDEKYLEAEEIFRSLGDFEDSESYVNEALYGQGVLLYNSNLFEEAFQYFQKTSGYKKSDLYIANITLFLKEKMQIRIYEEAYKLFSSGEYSSALTEFSKIEDYADSSELIRRCNDIISRREMATTISAGIQYSLGVTSDGKVCTTGYNDDGQSEISEWSDIVSISGFGVLSIGLKNDGTVVNAGKADGRAIDTSGWENIIAVSAGERYVIGLKNDGTVVGAGHRADGQLRVSDWTNIVAISTGWRHTVGLDKNGEIHITGYGAKRQLQEIEQNADAWEGIIAIAAGGGSNGVGGGHTVGLKEDGTVVAVGDKERQQCAVTGWTDIVAIAAGDWHTVGLRSDGTVVATGNDGTDTFEMYDNACAVDGWTNIVAIAAGSGYTLGLKSDGSIVYVGYNDSSKGENATKWDEISRYSEFTEKVNLDMDTQ